MLQKFIYAGIFLNGNAGIGKITPAEKLVVAENIQASGFAEAASPVFPLPKTYYYFICGLDIFAKKSPIDSGLNTQLK